MEQVEISREQIVREKSRKGLLYWSLASMSIFFGAFLSYYMVMLGNSNWLIYELPDLFLISTAVIVTSSITLILARNAVKKNDFKVVSITLLSTLILGIAFCFIQLNAWSFLISKGIYFSGSKSNVSGSIMYVITFLHFVHIIAGLIALSYTFFRSLKHRYTAQFHLGLSLCSIFWHFLDILWVVLFLFLYFNR
ncbi:MAG: heme-copper oxidase subunit III [Bacteroidia bacterium]